MGRLRDWAEERLDQVVDGAQSVFGVAQDALGEVSDAMDEAGKALDGLFDAAGDAIKTVAGEVDDVLQGAANTAMGAAGDARDAFEDLMKDSQAFLDANAKALDDVRAGNWSNLAGDAEAILDAAMDGMADFTTGCIALLEGALEVGLDTTVGFTEAAWHGIEEGTEFSVKVTEAVVDGIGVAGGLAFDLFVDSLEAGAAAAERASVWIHDDIEDMGAILAMAGGCMGGQIVHSHARMAALTMNIGNAGRRLPQDFLDKLPALYGGQRFDDVWIVENANLPTKYFDKTVVAMTFGGANVGGAWINHLVYLRDAFDRTSYWSKTLLCHELIHVVQYRRSFNNDAFACAYGAGYVAAGFSYEDNPMEKVAEDFEKAETARIMLL